MIYLRYIYCISVCLREIETLNNALTERGTDATGIAYNSKGSLVIHKEPKNARCIIFKHPNDVKAVMGHTRHTTQGNEKRNYNNHPLLFKEIKKANFEEIDISEGDILSINTTGTLICNHFDYLNTNYYGYNWWNYKSSRFKDNTYLEDLKTVANCYGYDPDTIDDLFQAGFTPEEIEEYIYCCE